MRAIVCLAALASLPGCGMFAVNEQQQKIDANCFIGGQVTVERKAAAPVVVLLLRLAGPDPDKSGSWQLADHFVLEGPGSWQFVASTGTYALAALQDVNRDLKLQPDEPFLRPEPGSRFTCQPGEERPGLALRIPAAGRARMTEVQDIATLQARSVGEQFAISLSQLTAIGETAALSDARFDPGVAKDSLWRPFDFLMNRYPGIYFLQPYERAKVPVLFVHGMNGTPRNFTALVERLDRRRFQPWVYYYPSGASLPQVADHLTQTVRKLELQYGFRELAIVAHSMGGVVARGFLQRYRAGGGKAALPVFVTLATPWNGDKGAVLGVKTAPMVVRVWVDISPGSAYLQSLYASDPGVPHYLFFAFHQDGVSVGGATDGAVTLASQLAPLAQRGAMRVEGFDETHMSILESAEVAQRVYGLLESRTGTRQGGTQ